MKYNEFGEVISVNGLTTGHHIGMPLQDACPAKPEDNEPYAIAKQTVGNCKNTPCDTDVCDKPDWNQNNPSAPDYVKNRPFYIGDPAEVVYFNETVVIDNGWGELSSTPNFAEGETYFVNFDGVVYECVYDGEVLGSYELWSGNVVDGEPPFCVDYDGAVGAITNGDHTLKVYRIIPVVKTIDPKYFPDGYTLSIDVYKLIPSISWDVTNHEYACTAEAWAEIYGKAFAVCTGLCAAHSSEQSVVCAEIGNANDIVGNSFVIRQLAYYTSDASITFRLVNVAVMYDSNTQKVTTTKTKTDLN